jgi:hypothetical protein
VSLGDESGVRADRGHDEAKALADEFIHTKGSGAIVGSAPMPATGGAPDGAHPKVADRWGHEGAQGVCPGATQSQAATR